MSRSRLIRSISSHAKSPTRSDTTEGVATELARITPRDRWILDLLAEHRVFTTDQIAAMAFSSLSRARSRLAQLSSRGVVDRFRGYVHSGSQKWRWTVGSLGASILAAAHDRPAPRPAAVRESTARLAASPFLSHLLGVNGFFAQLIAHTRAHPNTQLARWWSEARATRETGGIVRPDGHGLWVQDDRRVGFWLEHDTGTESLRHLASKLDDYASFADVDEHGHPVLFWVPSSVREANLRAHLARVGAPAGVTVATAAVDHADGGGGPAGRVWQLLGRPGRVALTDLTARPGDLPEW